MTPVLKKADDYAADLAKVYHYFNKIVPITKHEFSVISGFWEVRHFNRKQQVVKKGETDIYCNIVMRGLVRKYAMSGKKEVTRQLAMEGDFIFSEISFYKGAPSPVIIETIEAAILLSIKKADAEYLYREFPKLEKLGRKLASEMFIQKDSHTFENLNKSVRERFLDYIKLHPDMLQRIPQKYLASYLNIKPETFSRLKHLLKHKQV